MKKKKLSLEKINEKIFRMVQLWPALELFDMPQYDKISNEYQKLIKEVTTALLPTMDLLAAAKMFDIPYQDAKRKCTNSYEVQSVCVNGGFQLNTKEWEDELEKNYYSKKKKKKKK